MIVVEIGCGNKPGPFFEGAGEHFAVDAYAPDILEVLLARTEMTPLVADASDLGFDDESVDVVLARNVFGDIALGMSDEDRYDLAWAIKALTEGEEVEGGEEALESFAAIEAESASKKIDILRETGRILVVGGKLIVVEQESPMVAERFFSGARQRDDFDLLEVFGIKHNVPLADVTPPNYARAHGGHSKLQTWVATKRPSEPADHELPDLGGAGMGQSGIELP